VVRCWHCCLSGARCRLAYGPTDATATHFSCFSKIQIGFTFLVLAHHWVVLEKGLLNRCVCVCRMVLLAMRKLLTRAYYCCCHACAAMQSRWSMRLTSLTTVCRACWVDMTDTSMTTCTPVPLHRHLTALRYGYKHCISHAQIVSSDFIVICDLLNCVSMLFLLFSFSVFHFLAFGSMR